MTNTFQMHGCVDIIVARQKGNRILPSLILELVKHGIEITLKLEQEELRYYIEGFYKEDGSTYLTNYDKESFYVSGRYAKNYKFIESLRELVIINYQKWLDYRNKYEGWSQPAANWIKLFQNFDLVEKVDYYA